ncbi:MAG: hypothetical protein WD646_04510 [Actinomycetota bacterium]
MNVESALDQLYAAGLDEFTATRNALAFELASAGDARASTQIKALKKPNLAAWALNQLARNHPAELEELVAATDRVRRAHRRALSGGKATDLREATDERNRVVSRLTKLAGFVLTDAGHAAATATLAAVSDSFVAIASDEVGAELLKKGRLSRELRPGAIVDVGGLTLVPEEAEEGAAPTQRDLSAIQSARVAVNEARQKLKGANDAVRDADAEAWRLSGEADEAERRAKASREAAEFAKRAADARRADAEQATKALDEAQEALKTLDESS